MTRVSANTNFTTTMAKALPRSWKMMLTIPFFQWIAWVAMAPIVMAVLKCPHEMGPAPMMRIP